MAPTSDEVAAFTGEMAQFFAAADFFRFVRRQSHGLAEDNPWGEPPYLCWWQDVTVQREGSLVTFRHDRSADNMLAHMGRLVGPVVGAFLMLPGGERQGPVRELVLGYLRGISAMFLGSVWAGAMTAKTGSPRSTRKPPSLATTVTRGCSGTSTSRRSRPPSCTATRAPRRSWLAWERAWMS